MQMTEEWKDRGEEWEIYCLITSFKRQEERKWAAMCKKSLNILHVIPICSQAHQPMSCFSMNTVWMSHTVFRCVDPGDGLLDPEFEVLTQRG